MKTDLDIVKEFLPQREPFLFVDKIINIDTANITAEYFIKGDEYFFIGHFPNNAIMPGHLIAEALAQSALIMIKKDRFKNFKSPIFLLTKSHMRFLYPARPGDKLLLNAKATKIISNAGIAYVEAFVGINMVATGEVTVAVRENE